MSDDKCHGDMTRGGEATGAMTAGGLTPQLMERLGVANMTLGFGVWSLGFKVRIRILKDK